MTDNEIIKALECCVNWGGTTSCADCPYHNTGCIHFDKLQETLDLINRQKADNCELQHKNNELQHKIDELQDRNRKCIYLSDAETTEYCVDAMCPQFKTEKQIKAEAIKEFAERLKEFTYKGFWETHGYVSEAEIDRVTKEMVGNNNESEN